MATPRSPLLSGRAVASRLLDRARRRHRGELPPIKRVHSGLPSLDRLARQWWGLNLLAGAEGSGRTTLAARIALFTARAGGRVLWVEQDGSVDTPVFRLLTGLARVPARSVFVEPALEEAAWSALERTAEELAALPLQLTQAHGATAEELRRVIGRARSEGPLALVVVDGLGAPGRSYLQELDALAEEHLLPLLAVLDVPEEADWRDEGALLRGDLPQRPGALRLVLTRERPEAPAARPVSTRRQLSVFRAGRGLRGTISLDLDSACRWLEEVQVAKPEPSPRLGLSSLRAAP